MVAQKYEKVKTILNAMITVKTLCARRKCAVNTLQQLIARRWSVMDALKTLWERRVDAVWTMWGCCVQAISGKIDILCVVRGDPTSRWQVQNAVQTLLHCRLVWQGLKLFENHRRI